MSKTHRLDMGSVAVLTALASLQAAGAGYEHRGVRGWARMRDLERWVDPRLAERYPRLAAMGLADRDDVRAPGLRRPVWVYRITREGVGCLEGQGGALPAVEPPGEPVPGALYLAPGPRAALRELKRAAGTYHSSRFAPGGEGWVAATELLGALREEGGGPASPEALPWLVGAGLAERRQVRPGGRQGAVVLYRATPAGLAASSLEWREPPPRQP